MVTVTKEMLEWQDDTCGLYKTPEGYVLVEYSSGDARWMNHSQAKDFMRFNRNHKEA